MQGPSSAYKTYIRVDASNRPINSTNKLQKTRPKQGRWIEVDLTGNVCCDTIQLSFDIVALNPYPIITISTDEGNTMTLLANDSTDPATNDELVTLLNLHFGYLGSFHTSDDVLYLDLHKNIALKLSPSLDLTLNLSFD